MATEAGSGPGAQDTSGTSGSSGAAGSSAGAVTFDHQLRELGFQVQGSSRRGGRMWSLAFNRFLTFVLHDYGDTLVLSWSVALGEYLEERGWRSSVTDTSVVELYPQHDVRVPMEITAVEGEITRVLGSLRLDLADPHL